MKKKVTFIYDDKSMAKWGFDCHGDHITVANFDFGAHDKCIICAKCGALHIDMENDKKNKRMDKSKNKTNS